MSTPSPRPSSTPWWSVCNGPANRLAGVSADVLARWDTAGVWRSDGSRTAAGRLARDASMSLSTAHVELRRAHKLSAMPVAAGAVVAGRISMDHVDLLARADQPHRHHLFARDEAMLVEQCATLRHHQVVKAVEYWCQSADSRDAVRARTSRPSPPRHCTPPPRWTARSGSMARWTPSTGRSCPVSWPASNASCTSPTRRPVCRERMVSGWQQRWWRWRPGRRRRRSVRNGPSRCSRRWSVTTRRPGCVSWPTAPSSPPACSSPTSGWPRWRRSCSTARSPSSPPPPPVQLHRPVTTGDRSS